MSMDRDSYCTPRHIARRLPIVDLDPCSNVRSHIKARRSCMLSRGENGLLIPWTGLSVFCNPPYSNVLPFARKAWEASMFCFLLNADNSTKWYRKLTEFPVYKFDFYERIEFEAPPGVDQSDGNDRPQMMIASPDFYQLIKDSFKGLGEWWRNYV